MINPIQPWHTAAGIGDTVKKTSVADNFKAALGEALGSVNKLQLESDSIATQFAAGVQGIDIHDVTISSEKAKLALSLTIEIRNKLVEAYQDLMRMQI